MLAPEYHGTANPADSLLSVSAAPTLTSSFLVCSPTTTSGLVSSTVKPNYASTVVATVTSTYTQTYCVTLPAACPTSTWMATSLTGVLRMKAIASLPIKTPYWIRRPMMPSQPVNRFKRSSPERSASKKLTWTSANTRSISKTRSVD